jgi:hypothetical protein
MAQGIELAILPRGAGLWSDRGGSIKIDNPSGLCCRILLDLPANMPQRTAPAAKHSLRLADK